MQIQSDQYNKLIGEIGNLLALGRAKAAKEINAILVQTYWEIGKYLSNKWDTVPLIDMEPFDKISVPN